MADLEAQQHDSGHQQTDADHNEHTIAPLAILSLLVVAKATASLHHYLTRLSKVRLDTVRCTGL
jgi:hypothetical protein